MWICMVQKTSLSFCILAETFLLMDFGAFDPVFLPNIFVLSTPFPSAISFAKPFFSWDLSNLYTFINWHRIFSHEYFPEFQWHCPHFSFTAFFQKVFPHIYKDIAFSALWCTHSLVVPTYYEHLPLHPLGLFFSFLFLGEEELNK